MVKADYIWKMLPKKLLFKEKGDFLILLTPHSNEPLGLLSLNKKVKNCEYCLNTDIGNRNSRFDLSCNFYDFLRIHYLPHLSKQVEFSYTDNPFYEVEFRARQIYQKSINKKLVISIHNDPTRSFFYAYSQEPSSYLNKLLKDINCDKINIYNTDLVEVSYTKKLDDLIYSYFENKSIGLKNNESFGCFFKKKKIKAISIEVPMFNWNVVDSITYQKLTNVYFAILNEQDKNKKKNFIESIKEEAKRVPMYDVNILTEALNILIDRLVTKEE